MSNIYDASCNVGCAVERQSRGIFYLTFNGVYHSTNGIASQTRAFLGTLDQRLTDLYKEFGAFEFHIVSPEPYYSDWSVDEQQLGYAKEIAVRTGGQLHLVPRINLNAPFWSIPSWSALCASAASIVSEHAAHLRESVVLTVDAPFLHTGCAVERWTKSVDVSSVHCPYSSYALFRTLEPHPEREEWE